jgi:hypothetical protein
MKLYAVAVLVLLPALAEAGPPLICHPFETASARLLPWGTGPGWNTPNARYDIRQLTADTLALLTPDLPILERMENMRRATIYATRDHRVAEALLAAILARAEQPAADRVAVFDAGYLIESYKQAQHLFGRTMTARDGYALVRQAMTDGPPAAEMEFAAALMSAGTKAREHLDRARSAAGAQSLLAKNIQNLGW